MDGNQYSMWDYWSGKYDPVVALTEYFPETLASNDQLKAALAQYQNALLVMNKIMGDLKDKEEDEDDGLG